MLFNSLYFLLFLLIVLIGYHAVLRSFAARKLFLLGASWAFYASWSPRFLLLLITTTFIDFDLARVIFRARNAGAMHRARVLLVGSLAINLGLLAFFKYGLFFYQSANALVALPPPAGFLSVVVPLGISFYTFHSISYVIDTYRGIRPPTDSFADFALYVAFFPQLIAGPITRWVFEGVRQATLDELAEMGRAANRMLGLRERSVGSFSALAHLLNRSYVIDYARHPTADTLRAIA